MPSSVYSRRYVTLKLSTAGGNIPVPDLEEFIFLANPSTMVTITSPCCTQVFKV